MATTAQNRFNISPCMPITPNSGKDTNGKFQANITLAKGTVIGQVTSARASCVQTLTVTGTPTGGSFVIWVNCNGSSQPLTVAYNQAAAALQTSIQALSNVGSGNILVTGGALPGTPLVFTFAGDMAYQPQVLFSLGANSLTGGSSPAFSMAMTTPGVAGYAGTAGSSDYVPGSYGAYASGNSDGTQTPKGILMYDIAVDSTGKISLAAAPTGGQQGQKQLVAPFWYKGEFRVLDLTGFDSSALSGFARLISGTATDGIISLL